MKTPEWLLEGWSNELLQILEMMTAEQFSAGLSYSPNLALAELQWWQQTVSLGPDADVYAGATRDVAVEIGRKLLLSAGVSSVDEESALSTYLELLQQSTSGLARVIARNVGKPVECTSSGSIALPSDAALAFLTLRRESLELGPIALGFSGSLLAALAGTAAPRGVSSPRTETSLERLYGAVSSSSTLRNVDVLLDVEMPVSLCFGQSILRLKDVLELTGGSVVELNRQPDEPVEIMVNNCVIARGEVVVVDGNYGVRIQQIISRQERLGLHPAQTERELR